VGYTGGSLDANCAPTSLLALVFLLCVVAVVVGVIADFEPEEGADSVSLSPRDLRRTGVEEPREIAPWHPYCPWCPVSTGKRMAT
jgi:hypothetical protein